MKCEISVGRFTADVMKTNEAVTPRPAMLIVKGLTNSRGPSRNTLGIPRPPDPSLDARGDKPIAR
jgi:hypothetical protein